MKQLVRNLLGEKTYNTYLPMSSVNAKAFVEDLFEGTWEILAEGTVIGNPNPTITVAYDVKVQVRNSGTGKKAYLNFIAKSTANPDDIQTVLKGLTINGALIDEIIILGYAPLTFA